MFAKLWDRFHSDQTVMICQWSSYRFSRIHLFVGACPIAVERNQIEHSCVFFMKDCAWSVMQCMFGIVNLNGQFPFAWVFAFLGFRFVNMQNRVNH